MIADYHASYYAHELSRVGGILTDLAVRYSMYA